MTNTLTAERVAELRQWLTDDEEIACSFDEYALLLDTYARVAASPLWWARRSLSTGEIADVQSYPFTGLGGQQYGERVRILREDPQ